MTDEFLSPEQKAAFDAKNSAIRGENKIAAVETQLLDAVRVLKPNPYLMINGILKKTTGKGALEHIVDNGLGSMARQASGRRGMRRIVGSAATTAWRGMGRLWKQK